MANEKKQMENLGADNRGPGASPPSPVIAPIVSTDPNTVIKAGYERQGNGVYYIEYMGNGDKRAKRVDDINGNLPKGVVVP